MGCQKFEPERIIKIQTGTITDTTAFSCTAQGTIIDVGDGEIAQHGHCWATSKEPTTSDSKTELGSKNSTDSFESMMGEY